MLPERVRKLSYEVVPQQGSSSFTVREFSWPSFPFNWHYHPEVELTLIRKGSGLRFVGDSVQEFRDGDLCLLGSNTPHCWASHPNATRGVQSLVIQFLPDIGGAAFWQLPEMRAMGQLLQQAQRGLVFRGPGRHLLSEKILRLPQQPPGSWPRLSQLLSILEELAQRPHGESLASADYAQIQGADKERRLGQILEYIRDHIGQELTQHDVAKEARMSPQAFSQFFKRTIGKTFVQYVNELKICHVCRDLLETDQPITEVVYAAGFNNLSHFNAQFRRLKKMTPSQFRQAIREGVSHDRLESSEDKLGTFK